MSERQRLNELVSPKLMAVFIPNTDCYVEMCHDHGLKWETKENFPSYMNNLKEFEKQLGRLQAAGCKNIQTMRMAEYLDLQANDEFYVGWGQLVWVELGEEIPFGWRMGTHNSDE